MQLVVHQGGIVRCIYDEAVELSCLGRLKITRASHVEPTDDGQWRADLRPVEGPVLGPFSRRSEALDAEQGWLTEHWLFNDARSPLR